ncbi:MAG: FtsH protease activity modulator HflK [Pseudomonadales bacterium]
MAWNEPGKNGGQKDPWGGGDQGPPDLDEALKRFQERLGGIFGGGGASGGAASAGGPSAASFVVFLVVALLIWFAMGVYQVDQQERAVVLRLGVYNSTEAPGLHWNPKFIDEVTVVNVTKVRSHSHSAHMLTEDENIVEVTLSVQYTVSDLKNFLLEVSGPETTLADATESALRHAVGGSKMDQVLTAGREQLGIEVQQRLQNYLDAYLTGIQVAQVNIERTNPPAEVQAAFDDVIKAREDEVRSKNEAEAYANGIIPEARGQARRQIEEANADKDRAIAESEGEAARFEQLLSEYKKAPQVTRERLYLAAVQSVMESSSKVMIDSKGGNNLLYLPLDKIIQSTNSGAAPGSMSISESSMRQLTENIRRRLSNESAQNRRRESR